MMFNRTKPGVVATLALGLIGAPAAAQDDTIIERRDKVNNIIVIDDKLVVRKQLPGAESGISLNVKPEAPETYAKEEAIENRLEEDVRPAGQRAVLVRGETDNLVQAEGVFAIERSEKAEACVQIGTVGAEDDCTRKE